MFTFAVTDRRFAQRNASLIPGNGGTTETVAGETGSTTAWLRSALQYRLLNRLAFSNRDASLKAHTLTARKTLCSWADSAEAKFF